MEISELLESYLVIVDNENKNLINIAFDEMNSDQYEEAAEHFDQLYVKDSNDYMSYFFRAYCKSHLGTRGNVYPDSQKLSSAFELACKKAIVNKKDFEVDISLLLKMYEDGMDNLAFNAVEETTYDSNGNSHTSNPTKYEILGDARLNIANFLENNVETLKDYDSLKSYAIKYLKGIVDCNLTLFGPIVVAYDPSYKDILDEKISKENTKKTVKKVLTFLVVAAIIVYVIIAVIGVK